LNQIVNCTQFTHDIYFGCDCKTAFVQQIVKFFIPFGGGFDSHFIRADLAWSSVFDDFLELWYGGVEDEVDVDLFVQFGQ